MSLRLQTARRRLSNHNLSWKEIEAAVDNILTATSEKLGINHNWTFNYHYWALRTEPTIVLKAKHRDLPHAVAVKYLHHSRSGQTSLAQSEFAALSNLHTRLGPQHESVVTRPYAATRQGYSCEWVQLPSMKTVLLLGALSVAKREKCLETAAVNLRLIHEAQGVRRAALQTDLQVSRLKDSGGTSPAWMSAFDSFIALSRKFDGHTTLHGPVHADFTPGNILVGPKRCVIFDFGRHRENGPTYSDMTYFLAYVIAYCTFRPSRTAQTRIDRDIEVFMSAYDNRDAQDPELVRYFYLAHILNRWGRHEAKSQRTGRKFHLSTYDKLAAGRMERLAGELLDSFS